MERVQPLRLASIKQNGNEFKRPCPIKRDEQATSEYKSKIQEKISLRESVILKYAPRILDLAQKALVAVQELAAAESSAKAEIDTESTLFCSEEYTLDDAELAISNARYSAVEALKRRVE